MIEGYHRVLTYRQLKAMRSILRFIRCWGR